MAKSTMVKEQLTPEMIQLGKDLIKRLDETEIVIDSAFWFYMEDSEKWRLIIASPQVEEQGPKKVYQEVQKVLNSDESNKKIGLKDISVVENNHSLINLMNIAVGRIEGVSEKRFSKNTVNGHYIDDVLIYRLNS